MREWSQEGANVTSYLYTTDYKTYYRYDEAVSLSPYNPYCTYNFTPVPKTWGVPFAVGKAFLSFEGFGVLNTSKGLWSRSAQAVSESGVGQQLGARRHQARVDLASAASQQFRSSRRAWT